MVIHMAFQYSVHEDLASRKPRRHRVVENKHVLSGLTIVFVASEIRHVKRLHRYFPKVAGWTRTTCRSENEAGSNKREADVVVIGTVRILFGRPQSIILALGHSQLDFQSYTIGRVLKDTNDIKAPFDSFMLKESVMMNYAEVLITAVYLRNNEELMALIHC